MYHLISNTSLFHFLLRFKLLSIEEGTLSCLPGVFFAFLLFMARCNYSLLSTDWTLEYKPKTSNRRWTRKLSRHPDSDTSQDTDNILQNMLPQQDTRVRASQLCPITLPLHDLTDTVSVLRMPPLSLSPSLTNVVNNPGETLSWKLAQSCRTLNFGFRPHVLSQEHGVALYPQQSALSALEITQPGILPQNTRQDLRDETPGPSQPSDETEFPTIRHKQPGQVCLCVKCAVRRSIQLKQEAIQAIGISKIPDPNRNLQMRKFPESKRPYYYFCNFCGNFNSGTVKEMRAHIKLKHQGSVRGVTAAGKYFACPFPSCDLKFRKRGPLNDHVKEAH